jgi:hypothetical protein
MPLWLINSLAIHSLLDCYGKTIRMVFHPQTLNFGKHSLIWNIKDGPQVILAKGELAPRELTSREKQMLFSRADMWLKLDSGFEMLTKYIFLKGPVSLGRVINAINDYYLGKVTSHEKQVYKASHVFEFGWRNDLDFGTIMRNARRADLRGDSIYLEGFKYDSIIHLYTPFFGS